MTVQKTQKYDRQIRLWGEAGQEALEGACVCLLTAGPTGAEALKNLVLGGIGAFTIVDDARVDAADLGNNFLVEFESLGQSRAKSVAALLQEMNDSVAAKFVEEAPEALLSSSPEFFAGFSLVIATQMREVMAVRLDKVCRKHGVPVIFVRSYGLAGLLRISLKEHDVVESRPDNFVDDLRLHKPWPELQKHTDAVDVHVKDTMEHKHIPMAILLTKAAAQWKSGHGGSLPSTAAERSEFKSLLASWRRSEDEDNYEEALAAAFKVWTPPAIGSELRAVLEDKAADVTASSSDFWMLVAALKEFMRVDVDANLPLIGSIPDMTATSESYIALQRLYQEKADADVAAVEEHLHRILKSVGRDPTSIPHSAVKIFCKNARNLQVLRYKSLEEELLVSTKTNGTELQRLLSVEDNSNAALYVLFRSIDLFFSQHNRYPGAVDM
eukprot:TRINITY_DN6996_c0_g1_i4.p1 TRINITY_DN6996_c0_g1~~TRINITY_DN6996_c0_g1_i4.p1  ORF type:complete len:463 (+),score=126.87 TRINITY_DN6996_c0_g1_i4:71-1390(+)